jgi:hypothetical protein
MLEQAQFGVSSLNPIYGMNVHVSNPFPPIEMERKFFHKLTSLERKHS